MNIHKVKLGLVNYIQSPSGALIFLLLCLALITSIYLRDEAPSPLALEYKTKFDKRPVVPNSENSYIFLLGMDAPQNEDPVAQGIFRQAVIEKVAAGESGDIEKLFRLEFSYRYRASPEINKLRDSCKDPSTGSCLSLLNDNDAVVSEWLQREEWLLKRYIQLTSYQEYQQKNVGDINIPTPNYACALDGQKLLLIQLWQLSRKGETLRIQQALNSDAEYWRMFLRSSNQLISKVIATAALKRNLRVGNLLYKNIFETQKSFPEMTVPPSWEKPFTKEELSLNDALVGEWQLSSQLINNVKKMKGYEAHKGYINPGIRDWSDLLILCCLKPHMTNNQFAERLSYFMNQLDVPLTQYPDLKEKLNPESFVPSKNNSDFVGTALTINPAINNVAYAA